MMAAMRPVLACSSRAGTGFQLPILLTGAYRSSLSLLAAAAAAAAAATCESASKRSYSGRTRHANSTSITNYARPVACIWANLFSSSRQYSQRRPEKICTPLLPSPLVEVEWLAKNLNRVKVLDGSWYLPNAKRDPKKEFLDCRIRGARFFDIDAISDHSTSLPHMMPSAQQFAVAAEELGVGDDDVNQILTNSRHSFLTHTASVVVYDTSGLFSAARVWLTFKTFGLRDVGVLQGGLPAWLKHQLPVESGPESPSSGKRVVFRPTDKRIDYIKTYDDILVNSKASTPAFPVLDARSVGRFTGRDPEPRAGISSGHLPHSINVPYTELVTKDLNGVRLQYHTALIRDALGNECRNNNEFIKILSDVECDCSGLPEVLKPVDALRRALKDAGVELNEKNLNAPIVTSCGTGIMASVTALGLELLGHRNYSVYDGSQRLQVQYMSCSFIPSWTEYAQKKESPILKGEEKEKFQHAFQPK